MDEKDRYVGPRFSHSGNRLPRYVYEWQGDFIADTYTAAAMSVASNLSQAARVMEDLHEQLLEQSNVSHDAHDISDETRNYVLTHTGYNFVRADDDYIPMDGEIVLRRNYPRAFIGNGRDRLADLQPQQPQFFIQTLVSEGPVGFRQRDDGNLAMVLLGRRF